MIEFQGFQKIARLSRECRIMEKIDGTNSQIHITEDGEFLTGSKNRWITPTDDNYGFSRWAHEHKDELMLLGPGSHFGEWWGCGIQRNYGLKEKHFSLFNTGRWGAHGIEMPPACCDVVPVLYSGEFNTDIVALKLDILRTNGSVAAPGFYRPEGVVIYHTAAKCYFKKTIEKDDEPKSKQQG